MEQNKKVDEAASVFVCDKKHNERPRQETVEVSKERVTRPTSLFQSDPKITGKYNKITTRLRRPLKTKSLCERCSLR